MPFSGNPPSALRQEIRRLRSLTDKPFGVNLLLHYQVEEHLVVCLEEHVPILSFFWGNPSPFVEEWLDMEERGNESRPDEPVIGETRIGGEPAPVVRFKGYPPSKDTSGDIESMNLLAGQCVGLVSDIKPAATIVRELVEGVQEIIDQRLKGVLARSQN